MKTSDERLDVAENLRGVADYPGYEIRYMEQFIAELRETVFCDVCSDADYSEIFQRLADLIDPTCHLDLTDVETYGNVKVRIYECSRCGRSCEEIYGKYERCPHCGAREVNDDD